jgi:hypothetical protein
MGVERMEDLILVTGCTLVTSWAAAVFVDNNMEAEVSLASRSLSNSFVWSKVRGPVLYHNSRFDPVSSPDYVCSARTYFFSLLYGKQNPSSGTTPDQCVYIKGFRARRGFFRIKHIRAAAEPLPDDPDNRREDEIQVTQVPGVPKVSNLPM